jgi:hypothetical protein
MLGRRGHRSENRIEGDPWTRCPYDHLDRVVRPTSPLTRPGPIVVEKNWSIDPARANRLLAELANRAGVSTRSKPNETRSLLSSVLASGTPHGGIF